MQFSSLSKLLFSHCLCLPLLLLLQCSGSFYRISEEKKKRLLLYFFNRFLYRIASNSFQHDLVSALSLNQENYWMAVGEGSLAE